jgi:rhodanese-related sulfurtransferase/uncharacterized membrane protein YphA (DoxX/SURF4 family)
MNPCTFSMPNAESGQSRPKAAVSRIPAPLVTACRWAMAAVFVYAGALKIADPAGFARDIANYRILPEALVPLAALALPVLELAVGLCLAARLWHPGAAVALNAMLIAFLGALVAAMARGLDIQCGCFGSAVASGSMAGDLLRDLGFLCAGVLLLGDAGVFRTPGMVRRACVQAGVLLALSLAVGLALNAVRGDRIPLVAAHLERGSAPADSQRAVALPEVLRLVGEGAVIFDARPVREYERGRIREARSLPWNEVESRFMAATEDLDPRAPIVTYCDGESCELSHRLADFLAQAGFENVRVFVNGWKLWQEAGYPVDSGPPGDRASHPSEKS